MIKHFCDLCEAEIQGDHTQLTAKTTMRSKTRRPYELVVSITVAGAIEEEGHPEMCSACVFQAVDQVNPNPREAIG